MSYLGNLLRDKRTLKKISQEKLAKKLGWEHGQLVSNYERGVCYPPIKYLKKISKILGIPKNEIILAWSVDQDVKIAEVLK